MFVIELFDYNMMLDRSSAMYKGGDIYFISRRFKKDGISLDFIDDGWSESMAVITTANVLS